jgi:hypothetical protein
MERSDFAGEMLEDVRDELVAVEAGTEGERAIDLGSGVEQRASRVID